MLSNYVSAANATTGGVALGSSTQNIEVKKIVIGNPVASANIYLYDETNVGNVTNVTGLRAKLTLPGSFATGQLPFTIDLTDAVGHGITLVSGGSFAQDQALQATVLWDIAQMPEGVEA